VKNTILSALFLTWCLLAAAQSSAPLSFTENKGQWAGIARFRAEVPGGALFVRGTGFTVEQHDGADFERVTYMLHMRQNLDAANLNVRTHVYHADFIGANEKAEMVADKPIDGVSNYITGKDPARWGQGCVSYQGITVKDIYPNIDLRYYSENGRLKYDLIVRPGGDPDQIVLRYTGTDGLSVKEKSLNIRTSIGTVRELPPYAFQYGDAGRETVTCNYKLKDSTVRFHARGYDEKRTLVIDPTIVFASFSGSSANNWGFTATYGPDGSFFGGGIVFGQGFPVSSGAFEQNFGGGLFDVGIIKLSSNGSSRLYATYIGGSGDDQPHSLFCDGAGNLVVTGRTSSGSTFPIANTIGPSAAGFDIFVAKLNAGGTAITGGVRIGGSLDDGVNISSTRGRNSLQYNYGDDGRSEVILDGAGNIYVASCTRSANFPVLNGFKNTLSGSQDGVVFKLDPSANNLLFSSYLGGDGDDAAYVLSVSPATGNLYVAGGTASTDLAGTAATVGAGYHGGIDGFVTQLTNSGSFVRSTYIGTGAYDQIYGIQFDRSGFPYVMGQTLGNWPQVNATYYIGNSRQFIAKLQPDLSAYVYSTSFGTPGASQPNISPTAFLVDRCENVYVSGWGGVANSFSSAGTLGLPVTADAVVMNPPYTSPSQTDGKDFYFFVLKKNATQQLYGSFFGENTPAGFPDHVDGGTSRFDANGVIYQGVCANCNSPHAYWPTTTGAWAQTNGSTQCNLGMIKIALNLAGLASGVQSAIDGVVRDTAGCLPLTVNFRDTVANAVTYEWDFNGDGVTDQTTTAANASFTYNTVGTFHVRLIAVDLNSCNVRDTSYVNIRVGVLEAEPDFTFRKLDPCDSLRYEFVNTTPPQPTVPFTSTTFRWEFLDEGVTFTSGAGSFVHSFPRAGSYRVRLSLLDNSFCNAPDYKDTIVNVAVLVKAGVGTPESGCAPYNAVFENTSQGGQTFFWNFGNGSTSTLSTPPIQLYSTPGVYNGFLAVVDSGTCNITDTIPFTVTVYGKPTAGIGTVSPQPPVVNTAISFENTSSSEGVRFTWLFGDGDSTNTSNRLPVSHEYNTTDSFEVLLIAYNDVGCPDTARRRISTLVEPALDVPNAFIPAGGGINGIVFARGFGIATLHFTIWNRWGQKVFETTDRKFGWDGTYKGKPQPMDVYAYTLEATFVDGRKATKKGDITLIR
jgi:gliding motility-associated-like protein